MPIRVTDVAARYAETILAAIQREYPYAPAHVVSGAEDVGLSPRQLHPSFYGCFDWHSAVHMHWSLVHLLRTAPGMFDGAGARRVLQQNFLPSALNAEALYVRQHPGWERPYGWAWALTLADELAELAAAGDTDGRRWARNIRPLADVIADELVSWLPKLGSPVRTGTHTNSALALLLALPWGVRKAASTADTRLLDTILTTSRRWYDNDRNAPLSYEPQGLDFISPTLAEATLMAEILSAEEYSSWLARFMPTLSFSAGTLGEPVSVSDLDDGQLAHADGLNLSRAWMLRRIAATLPDFDLRRNVCQQAADRNESASLRSATNGRYMSEHWLATYAILALEAH